MGPLLNHHKISLHKFSGKVFLMEIGRVSDINKTRMDVFSRDMETFLGLKPSMLNMEKAVDQFRQDKEIKVVDPGWQIDIC